MSACNPCVVPSFQRMQRSCLSVNCDISAASQCGHLKRSWKNIILVLNKKLCLLAAHEAKVNKEMVKPKVDFDNNALKLR